MTLKELKECVETAYEEAGNPGADVEIWLGNKAFRIKEMWQSGVTGALSISLGPKIFEVDDEQQGDK